jgi:hypothetical protein
VAEPQRRLPFGNPADAPGAVVKIWKYGGTARAAVFIGAVALVVSVAVGVLVGVAGDHHVADWHVYGLIAGCLAGFVFFLAVLAGYLFYRGGPGPPKEDG